MSETQRRILNDKVIAAVEANDVEAVRTLLEQGAPVDARGAGEGRIRRFQPARRTYSLC